MMIDVKDPLLAPAKHQRGYRALRKFSIATLLIIACFGLFLVVRTNFSQQFSLNEDPVGFVDEDMVTREMGAKGTFTLTPLGGGGTPIDCKWVKFHSCGAVGCVGYATLAAGGTEFVTKILPAGNQARDGAATLAAMQEINTNQPRRDDDVRVVGCAPAPIGCNSFTTTLGGKAFSSYSMAVAPGITITKWFVDHNNDDEVIVESMFSRVANRLTAMWLSGWVHADLNSNNLLYDESTGGFTLIDVEGSTKKTIDKMDVLANVITVSGVQMLFPGQLKYGTKLLMWGRKYGDLMAAVVLDTIARRKAAAASQPLVPSGNASGTSSQVVIPQTKPVPAPPSTGGPSSTGGGTVVVVPPSSTVSKVPPTSSDDSSSSSSGGTVSNPAPVMVPPPVVKTLDSTEQIAVGEH